MQPHILFLVGKRWFAEEQLLELAVHILSAAAYFYMLPRRDLPQLGRALIKTLIILRMAFESEVAARGAHEN